MLWRFKIDELFRLYSTPIKGGFIQAYAAHSSGLIETPPASGGVFFRASSAKAGCAASTMQFIYLTGRFAPMDAEASFGRSGGQCFKSSRWHGKRSMHQWPSKRWIVMTSPLIDFSEKNGDFCLLLEQPASIRNAGCSKSLESINFSAFNRLIKGGLISALEQFARDHIRKVSSWTKCKPRLLPFTCIIPTISQACGGLDNSPPPRSISSRPM
jgi:hypothetical protein